VNQSILLSFRGLRYLLPVLAHVLAAPFAGASSAAFVAIFDGETRDINLGLYDAEGRGYVSLRDLGTQTGAACVVSPAQVSFDLEGYLALVGLNSNDVTASRGSFTLTHPVLPYEGDALIAVEDVSRFFGEAFGVEVSARQADGITQQAPGIEVTPTPDADLLGGPITMPTPAAGAAPRRPSAVNPIQKIVVDPGHGGEDPGVTGPGGAQEKDITLAIAQKLAARLRDTIGVEVVLTRDGDRSMSVNERINYANQQRGDLFVSIHTAASPVSRSYGFELFTPKVGAGASGYGPMNRYIAEIVGRALADAVDNELRPPREAPLKLLGDVAMPALLVEAGYLTNPSEESLLKSESHQTKLAHGIADGIRQVVEAYEGTP